MDWLASSADSLVGQAPAVAAELLAQAVGSIPAGSGQARVAGRPARRRALPHRRPGRGRADRRAGARLRRRPRPGGGPALDAGPMPDAGRLERRVLRDARPGARLTRALGQAPRPTARARPRAPTCTSATSTRPTGRPTARSPRPQEAGDTWATGWALHVLASVATDARTSSPTRCRSTTRAGGDRDRPRADRPRPAAPGQQGRDALQPRPVRRGARHRGARPAARGPGRHGRSGSGRRTASSASCSSRPGGGTTRWPRSIPCRWI